MTTVVFFKTHDTGSITFDNATFKHTSVDNKETYVANFNKDTPVPKDFKSRILISEEHYVADNANAADDRDAGRGDVAIADAEGADIKKFVSLEWRCVGPIEYTSDRHPLTRETCLKLASKEDEKLFVPDAYINHILTEQNIWMSFGCHGSHLIRYKNKLFRMTYNRMYCHQREIDQDKLTGHKHIIVDDHIFDLESF